MSLADQVRMRERAKRLKQRLAGDFEPKAVVRDGVIVSSKEVGIAGQRYPLDTTNTGLQVGQTVKVVPDYDSRLACAHYKLADGGTGGSGGGASFGPHDIIGRYHTTEANAGLFVGVNPDRTLAYLDPNDWVRLWIGREEGPRVGLRKLYNGDGTYTLALEAIDTANVPFFSAGAKDFVDGSEWLKLGKEGAPQIYLNATTGGMVVPLSTLASLITAGYIDLADLAANFYLAHDTTMPDALGYPAGNLRLMQSPGDSNLFVLWVRDHLDQWQLIGGAGYAFPHTHTSEETGGIILASGLTTRWEPLANGNPAAPALVFDAGGDVIMTEHTI